MRETLSSEKKRPAVCNCLALRQAARHVSQIYDSHLSSVGLRTTQFSILAKLNRMGPMSIGELAAEMIMDRTTLGRAIRPLERDKLLEISASNDRRRRSVGLTAAGRSRLESASVKWREAQRDFEAAFGKRQAAQLRDMMLRVVSTPAVSALPSRSD